MNLKIKTMMKKAGSFLAIAGWVLTGSPSVAAERLDRSLLTAASCQEAGMESSIAAYKLLLSSKVVSKDRMGPFIFYTAGQEPETQTRIWGLTPTKILIAEREDGGKALIGSIYSRDFPMNLTQIAGAFQGGLRRKISYTNVMNETLSRVGVSEAWMSTEPVFKDVFLFSTLMSNGDKVMLCGKESDLVYFLTKKITFNVK